MIKEIPHPIDKLLERNNILGLETRYEEFRDGVLEIIKNEN